jgi:hypothetical protein
MICRTVQSARRCRAQRSPAEAHPDRSSVEDMCRTSGCAACACGELDCVACAICEAEADAQDSFDGPNAGYLARRWFEQGKVEWFDGTDLVQLHERPSVPGADAFWHAHLRELAADGRGLSVVLRLEDGSLLW